MTVRIMVSGRLHRREDQEKFEATIQEVSRMLSGTPGYLKDELLRDPQDPTTYIMMSEWSSREMFLAWEQASIHKQNTNPLRTYWKADPAFRMYEIVVRLD